MKRFLFTYCLFIFFLAARNSYAYNSLLLNKEGVPSLRSDDCPVPQNLHTYFGTSTSVLVNWNSVVGSQIRYRLRWRQVNDQHWTERPITPNPSDKIIGLTNATTYEVQVQTICDGQPTSYSSGVTFTTACTIPEVGSVYDIARTTAQLFWGDFGEGTQYELRWRPTGTTSWPNSITLTGSSYKFTSLAPKTNYEYQLKTLCPDGHQSDYTSSRFFTTTACEEPSSLRSYDPVDERIMLAWLVNYNQTVDLQWRPTGASSWTTIQNLPTISPNQGNGKSTGFYSLTGLTHGTSYEWKVQTICEENNRSSFTLPQTFTATCGAPAYLDESQIQLTSANVFWRAVQGITYQAQWRVKNAPDTEWHTLPERLSPYNSIMIVQLTDLNPGVEYEWRVKTICSSNSSPFTTARSFRTTCGAPIDIGQVVVTSTSAHIQWNSVNSDTQYQVRWRRYNSTDWIQGDITNTPFYDITSLQTTTLYVYQVRSICGGQPSDFSSESTFLTNCNIPKLLLTTDVTATSAELSWAAFDNSTTYELQWRTSGSTDWPQSLTTSTMGIYVLANLTPNSTYEWRIRALCTDGNISDFTTINSFTTGSCLSMFTLQSGEWTSPYIWSCNRLPASTDTVEIRHTISIPADKTGKAHWLRYSEAGRLSLGKDARIKLHP